MCWWLGLYNTHPRNSQLSILPLHMLQCCPICIPLVRRHWSGATGSSKGRVAGPGEGRWQHVRRGPFAFWSSNFHYSLFLDLSHQLWKWLRLKLTPKSFPTEFHFPPTLSLLNWRLQGLVPCTGHLMGLNYLGRLKFSKLLGRWHFRDLQARFSSNVLGSAVNLICILGTKHFYKLQPKFT